MSFMFCFVFQTYTIKLLNYNFHHVFFDHGKLVQICKITDLKTYGTFFEHIWDILPEMYNIGP